MKEEEKTFSLPWNQTTFGGYSAEMCVSVLFALGYQIPLGTILLFFISICVHHHAFYVIFENSIKKWNRRREKSLLDRKFICDLIRFHISVKS